MPDERDYGERSNHHKSKHKSHHHYKGNEHHIIKVQTIARQHSAKKLVESKRSKVSFCMRSLEGSRDTARECSYFSE